MTRALRLVPDADLTRRNTFGVPARARLLAEVADTTALPSLFAAELAGGPVMVLGGGSNLLFAGDPRGAVLALRGERMTTVAAEGSAVRVRAEAGAGWDSFVRWTLSRGLAGLENLALVPGTVGAAPIQNIGAYGVEASDTIVAVEAFEPATGTLHRFAAPACAFAYRDSLFKREAGRYVVTAVEFQLTREKPGHGAPPRIDYAGMRDELDAMGVGDVPTAAQVADAVTAIRRRKLPDPARIGNAGSFFKNPIVPESLARDLAQAHPGMPVFPAAPFPADAAAHGEAGDGVRRKLSAGWLIDQCGWKGHREGDAGVAASHALVLVNHGTATGAELLELARRIAGSVQDRFGVALEPEPRIVGDTW
ncbi:MAG TPA: UDP-N-acetylmuramate dehydrogenase [Xanthomonadaceae bacterium]|nr:UDP-N-acetylmuramate dehydrogenase [Xanthomonadaceae bacterium]